MRRRKSGLWLKNRDKTQSKAETHHILDDSKHEQEKDHSPDKNLKTELDKALKTPESNKFLNANEKAEHHVSLTPRIIDEPIYKNKTQPLDIHHQMQSHQDAKIEKVDGFVEEHRACPSDAEADIDSAEPESSPVYIVHTQNQVRAETPKSNEVKLNFYQGDHHMHKEEHEIRLEDPVHHEDQIELIHAHKAKEDVQNQEEDKEENMELENQELDDQGEDIQDSNEDLHEHNDHTDRHSKHENSNHDHHSSHNRSQISHNHEKHSQDLHAQDLHIHDHSYDHKHHEEELHEQHDRKSSLVTPQVLEMDENHEFHPVKLDKNLQSNQNLHDLENSHETLSHKDNQYVQDHETLDDNNKVSIHSKYSDDLRMSHSNHGSEIHARQDFADEQAYEDEDEEIKYEEDDLAQSSSQIDHPIKEPVHSQLFRDFDADNEEQESKQYSSHHASHYELEDDVHQSEAELQEADEEYSDQNKYDFHSVPADQAIAEQEEHYVPPSSLPDEPELS